MALVLVVDDEPSFRFLLRVTFESAGYEVTEAGDGEAALAEVASAPPDLISTDYMMPLLDGGGLIRRLRLDPATAAIPIIMISNSEGAEERAPEADVFLRKPLEPNVLLGQASVLLTRKGKV
jgi:CheY-like chemotaxis protein